MSTRAFDCDNRLRRRQQPPDHHPDTHCHRHLHGYCDTRPDLYGRSNCRLNRDSHGQRYSECDTHPDRYSHCNCERYDYAKCDLDRHTFPHRHKHGERDAHCHSYDQRDRHLSQWDGTGQSDWSGSGRRGSAVYSDLHRLR